MRLIQLMMAAVLVILPAACSSETDNGAADIRTSVERGMNPSQGPALWRVADADTEVFLFGTVHILRPDFDWRSDEVIEALAASDAVYFEADVDSTQAQGDINRIARDVGFYTDGSTLGDVLSSAERQEVVEAADLLGVTFTGFTNFKPWAATIALSDIHLEQLGYSRDHGVEDVLNAEARRRAKPIRYLETAVEQIALLGGLPEEDQVSMLVQTATQIEDDPNYLDKLVDEWAEGDVNTLEALIATDEAFGSGVVYETMLVGRNERWVADIDRLLDEETGTFLIAVGAAHLAGDDSVQNLLAKKGHRAERR